MTPIYKKLIRDTHSIDRKIDKLIRKRNELKDELKRERQDFVISCPCGTSVRVGDIELIEEDSGSYDAYGEIYYSKLQHYFVCTGCTEVCQAPKAANLYPGGFEAYVGVIRKWDTNYRPDSRVAELLEPSRRRAKEAMLAQEKNAQIEAARRVLKEAGEL